MLHSLQFIFLAALPFIQFSSSGYEHDVKRHAWRNEDDNFSNFNPKRVTPGGLNMAEYGTQFWNSEGNKQETKSSKNASYNVVPNWPDPTKKFGQLSAVSLDADGNVVIFHRGDRIWDSNSFLINNIYNQRELGSITQNTILTFNVSTGLLVNEWGSSLFYLPHGLTIDSNNNVWVTDVALHQVFKFAPGGGKSSKALITLGIAFVPGSDDNHFCKPTAVAIMSNGDFFVSDGYCNTRIMKFSSTGKLLLQWGRNTFQGSRVNGVLPPYEFTIPHALALAEDKQILCVADRENGRIQCFNCHNGTFVTQYYNMGTRLFSVAYSPVHGGLLYVVNGPELFNFGHVSGFIRSMVNKEMSIQFSQEFSNPHDIAVSQDGTQIYVVELDPYKVWKFVNGDVNINNVKSHITLNNSASTMKPQLKSQHDINFSKQQMVEVPKSRSPAGTIATAVGIVVGIAAVFAVLIFAAVIKMRKRGGSYINATDDLEYRKLVE